LRKSANLATALQARRLFLPKHLALLICETCSDAKFSAFVIDSQRAGFPGTLAFTFLNFLDF
jgi:hypothetical protein